MGYLSPTDVVAWATNQVARGHEGEAMLALACLSPGAEAEVVDALLADALVEGGVEQLEPRAWHRIAAAYLAAEALRAGDGMHTAGRRIVRFLYGGPAHEDVRPLWFFVSEWEDTFTHRKEYDDDIREELHRIAEWDPTPPSAPEGSTASPPGSS